MDATQLSLFSITDTQEEYRRARLRTHRASVLSCVDCSCRSEFGPLYGRGAVFPVIAFVTEAPSREDEFDGSLLRGKAEEVVTRMLSFLELEEKDAYFCSAVCCRPRFSRVPTLEELQACRENMQEQLSIVQPTLVFALGHSAAKALLNTPQPIDALRGEWYQVKGTPMRVTHHPHAVLKHRVRADEMKEDLQAVRRRLDHIREMKT